MTRRSHSAEFLTIINQALEGLRRMRHTLIPLPIRYGRHFRRTYSFLLDQQTKSSEEIESYQWDRLLSIVNYAYNHVPFYRRQFDSIGLLPGDIKSKTDFSKIPCLTREEVTQYADELKSDEFKRLQPLQTVTSGTSRDRLKVFRSAEAEIWRKAIMWRHFNRIGYRFRDPRAQFTGKLRFLKEGGFSSVDYNENLLMIEQFSITRERAREIHRLLNEFRPKLIYCQPANIATLIIFFEEQQLPRFHVPIVYTTGEMIYPQYRQVIESYFCTKIIDYYGNRENTVAAMELEDGRKYIQSEYCYLEFVDSSGNSVLNQQAEIVATTLVNYAFPLIRYHTDDLGIDRGYPNNRIANYPIMEIVGGRGKDLILTRKGLVYPQIEMENGAEKFLRVRVEQTAIDKLHITFVPTKAFVRGADQELLLKAYNDYFRNEFQLSIEQVEDIPFTESGKNKLYVSTLAMEHLRNRLSNS